MARMPVGATLIDNPVSKAPGFQMGNVFVMAGVPKIMNAMMEDVATRLTKGVADAVALASSSAAARAMWPSRWAKSRRHIPPW